MVMSGSRPSEHGFTLVELVVVVAIMGILSAVALPAFLGHTRGASDAKAKTDVANAQRALDVYGAEHGSYDVTRADLVATEAAVGSALNLTVTGGPSTYRVSAESKRGSTFVVEKTAGGIDRTCAPAGSGGCSNDATW